jgi:hypothetical protein
MSQNIKRNRIINVKEFQSVLLRYQVFPSFENEKQRTPTWGRRNEASAKGKRKQKEKANDPTSRIFQLRHVLSLPLDKWLFLAWCAKGLQK